MLIQHIALVPEAAGIDPSELARVSAALQKQLTRDLAPAWGVHATIDAFPRLEDVPSGYWPILVTRDIGSDSGVRLDRDGTPYAQVEHSPDWSIDASRACLEMLVNPFGKRTVSAPSPRSDQGRVEVVLEICAPCADVLCAYVINDVVVSDFCLPAFYEEGSIAAGKRLSFNGSISAPFRVLPGGHLTWFDVVSESFWRRSHWSENPIDTRLGKLALDAAQTLPARSPSHSPAHEAFQARIELDRQHARRVSEVRAMRLRASFVASGLSAAPVALPRTAARGHDVEPITVVDVDTEAPAPRASAVPPPLPRASKPAQPAAAAPPTPSTAPVSVSILRETERTPKSMPVLIAGGALAAAAALALVWRANVQSEQATSPSIVTTAETATAAAAPVADAAPAPAPIVAAPAPLPLVAPTAPAAVAEPPKEQLATAAPAATTPKTKRTKPRASLEVEPAAAPSTPAPAAAPPTPPAPEPVPVTAKTEPSSIDALIDTRR